MKNNFKNPIFIANIVAAVVLLLLVIGQVFDNTISFIFILIAIALVVAAFAAPEKNTKGQQTI